MKLHSLLIALLLCLVSMPMQGTTGAHQWADTSVLAEGMWVKIALDDTSDGIYQITYSQLKSWGFAHPEKVGVYGFGGHNLPESFANGHYDDLPEVAVLHDTDNQRILFYGRGLVEWSYQDDDYRFVHRWNTYSSKAYYFVHETEKPLEMQQLACGSEQGLPVVTQFDELLLHEQNNINIGEAGKEFYGESFLSTQIQRFVLSGQTLNAGSALLTVNLAASTSEASSIKASINNQDAGSATISKITTSYTFANDGTINETLSDFDDLTSPTVSLTYSCSDKNGKVARLNYIRLQGKSPLAASSKEPFLLFRSSEAQQQRVQYQLSGLTGKMQIWDVTDPTNISLQATDSKGCFIAPKAGIREYAIVNTALTSGFTGVSFVNQVSNQNLHAIKGANLVIVTAPGYQQYAEQLAAFRSSHDGLSALVVTPEAIYNEYASGTPDATAIRLFLKQMYDRKQQGKCTEAEQLRYLLLIGDGSYNNTKSALSNYLLLTYQSDASLRETASCTCDDYFGFLDDEEGGRLDDQNRYTISSDKLDIGIGRLPVKNSEEAENVINKLITYGENHYYGPWKNRLVFLSDDDKNDNSGKDSPNLHMRHNEQLIGSMQRAGHLGFIYQKIYLPAYQQVTSSSGKEYPGAMKEFQEALQQGTMLVNYAGHGAASNITHENMMTTAKAEELRMKNLPLWVCASCDVCRWDAEETSMGETLLLNANGGAIGVIGSARVVYAPNNLVLNQGIVDHLLSKNSDGSCYRLGDIIMAAKLQVGNEFNKLNYSLLGDPSLTLSYPKQQLQVDAIEYDELVTVSGHVVDAKTQTTDTTFNGLLYPTIYGAEDSIVANKGYWQEPALTFASRTKKVFSGRDLIRNGRFEFSFTIPTDASKASGLGLVNLYACSEEGAEAMGFQQNFQITANSEHKEDTEGPEIVALFLEESSFRSGDEVGTTPYFYAEAKDASGFNTTGNSIGHDITLTISCLSNPVIKPQQYVLNSYFTTFTGDPSTGNIKYSLPQMEEGTYEATFRIWDAFNNASTAIFEFVVSETAAPKICLAQAYPSPVRQGETVTFRVMHNRPESADEMHLQIFTQMGRKILDKVVTSTASEVVFLKENAKAKTDISDAMNADETSQLMGCSSTTWSATVAPGIYMYRIYFKSDKGEASSDGRKLIVK